MMTATYRFPRALLFLLAGPLIWAAHFVSVYAVNGVFCARRTQQLLWAGVPAVSWIVIALSVIALAAMTACWLRQRRRMPPMAHPGFLSWASGGLTLLSAVAVVWQTFPVLLMSGCL